jgi:prepilin-type processing-associated H-X9-DG protein
MGWVNEGTGNPWLNEHGRFKTTRLRRGADIIYFTESEKEYGACWFNSPFPFTFYKSDRHAASMKEAGANIVFMDGHVEYKLRNWIEEPSAAWVGAIGSTNQQIGWGGYRFKVW